MLLALLQASIVNYFQTIFSDKPFFSSVYYMCSTSHVGYLFAFSIWFATKSKNVLHHHACCWFGSCGIGFGVPLIWHDTVCKLRHRYFQCLWHTLMGIFAFRMYAVHNTEGIRRRCKCLEMLQPAEHQCGF